MTWYSQDGCTQIKLDHVVFRDCRSFQSCRVFRGAECSVNTEEGNTDHTLVVAMMKVSFCLPPRHPVTKKFDVETMLHIEDISKRFVLDVQNRFAAVTDLPDYFEEAWSVFSHS